MADFNQPIKSTDYCDLLKEVQFEDGEYVSKIQQIRVKEKNEVEIRFACYKNNRLVLRPLDVNEEKLFYLFKEAIDNEVFPPSFIQKLRSFLLQKDV